MICPKCKSKEGGWYAMVRVTGIRKKRCWINPKGKAVDYQDDDYRVIETVMDKLYCNACHSFYFKLDADGRIIKEQPGTASRHSQSMGGAGSGS